MPDTFTPTAGFTLVEDASTAWGPKQRANWSIADSMASRMAVLESFHAASIPNFWPVPAGSTWAEFVAIYNAINPGDYMVLPASNIDQTAGLHLTKPFHLIGSHPTLSTITTRGLLSLPGGGGNKQFRVSQIPAEGRDTYPSGMFEFANLKIIHDRTGTPRQNVMSIAGGGTGFGVNVHNCIFENISSDVMTLFAPLETGYTLENVHFHHNIVNEWWESVFNIHGPAKHCSCYNNYCITNSGHPSGGVSRPYGIYLAIENVSTGASTMFDILIENNELYLYTMSPVNTLGISLKNVISAFLMNRIRISRNRVHGFTIGIKVSAINSGFDCNTVNVIEGNYVSGAQTGAFEYNAYGGQSPGFTDVIHHVDNYYRRYNAAQADPRLYNNQGHPEGQGPGMILNEYNNTILLPLDLAPSDPDPPEDWVGRLF